MSTSPTAAPPLGGSEGRAAALLAQPAVRVLGAILVLAAGAYLLADEAVVEHARNAAHAGLSRPAAGLLAAARVLGKGEVAVFAGLLAAVAGRRRIALQILVALAICAAIVWPLKVAMNRERPNGADCVSFPSGDAASSTAAAVPIAVASPGLVPVAALVATSVAAARVVVGAHHPSDALFGMAVGLFSALLAMRLSRRWRSPVDPVWIARGAWAALGVWWFFVVRGRGGDTTRFLALYGPALLVAGIFAGLFWPSGASGAGLGGSLRRGAGLLACAAMGLGTAWLFRELAASPEGARAAWFPPALLVLVSAAAVVRGAQAGRPLRAGVALAASVALLWLMLSSSRLLPGHGWAGIRSTSPDDPSAIPQRLGEWGMARTASWKACRHKVAREAGGR